MLGFHWLRKLRSQSPCIYLVPWTTSNPILPLASESQSNSCASMSCWKSMNGQQNTLGWLMKVCHIVRSRHISLVTQTWWCGFKFGLAVWAYSHLVNAWPGTTHLHTKLRKPQICCNFSRVIFFLLKAVEINCLTLNTFSIGSETVWLTVSINKPKNVRSVVALKVFSKDIGKWINSQISIKISTCALHRHFSNWMNR